MKRTRRFWVLLALAAVASAIAWAAPAHAGPITWCGSGEPTSDLPDAVNAFEWHAIYAVPSDGVDQFGFYAPRIAGDAAAISNWWLNQDSTRRPRYDLIDAPGCSTEPYGRLDISFVRLPQPNAAYNYNAIVADLKAAGFDNVDKGYVVYYDGSQHTGDAYGVCGIGGGDTQAEAYSVAYLQTCGLSYGDDTRAMVVAHEMLHGMGAVPSAAPHACNSGHVCDNPSDIMKAVFGQGDTIFTSNLDVGRDDYYGHHGSWWDVRNSELLYDLDRSLDPAPDIANFTATSVGTAVTVSWGTVATNQGVRYRVYDDQGNLVQDEPSSRLTATGDLGSILTWTVRSENGGYFLSTPATLRFKVGYGVVDPAGTLLRDTVPPAAVTGLRATRSGTQLVLRWGAVSDPISVRGYRVSAPGMRPVVVATTSSRLVLKSVRGKLLSVAAVDGAGNVGPAAAVRAPR